MVLPKPNGDIAKSLKSQRTAPINIALVMHPDSEPNDDERINWPAVGMIAVAVIDALIISLGNLSGCWLILPYGPAAETVDGFDKTIMAGR